MKKSIQWLMVACLAYNAASLYAWRKPYPSACRAWWCEHGYKTRNARGAYPYAVIDVADDISTNTYRFEVDSETTVMDLKNGIEKESGVPAERQHIWFDDQELYDYWHMRNVPNLHNHERFMLTDEPEDTGYGTE